MKKTLGVLCFLVSTVAFAAPAIKQINANSDQVAVNSTKETTIGSKWVATQKSGGQCQLEVVQQSSSSAILEGSGCDFTQLKVGQKLEKSLFTSEAGKSSTSTGPRWMKKLEGFSAIAFLNVADDIGYTANSVNGNVSTNKAFGLGAEYLYDLKEATEGLPLGVIAGATYEFARDFDSYSENGQTFNYTGKKPNLGVWATYLNAQVNLANSFGLVGGVNYSIPMLSNAGNLKLKSALGYQIGATVQFSKHIAADALYRWVNFGANNGISDVSLDGFSVRGRYAF